MAKKGLIYTDDNNILFMNKGNNKYNKINGYKNNFLEQCNRFHETLLDKKNFEYKEISSVLDLFEIINMHKDGNDLIVLAKINSRSGEYFSEYDIDNTLISTNKFLPSFYEIVNITIRSSNTNNNYYIHDIEILEIDTNYEPYEIKKNPLFPQQARIIFKQNKVSKMFNKLLGIKNIDKIDYSDSSIILHTSIDRYDIEEYFIDDFNEIAKYYFNIEKNIVTFETTGDDNMIKVIVSPM